MSRFQFCSDTFMHYWDGFKSTWKKGIYRCRITLDCDFGFICCLILSILPIDIKQDLQVVENKFCTDNIRADEKQRISQDLLCFENEHHMEPSELLSIQNAPQLKQLGNQIDAFVLDRLDELD